ncbi:MAG: T9SS type A sorting domain-containing protein [Bacteroidales bacterium]|nr:T9SS type A sorting domain-containing protein [Bacteroidales bacterium]
MKTILILAFLLLSVSLNAQNQHSSRAAGNNFKIKDITDNLPVDTQRFDHIVRTTQGYPLSDGSVIQVYDSIYHWISIDPGIGFNLDYKIIDMVYNDNYNLTGKLMQQWNGTSWVNYYRYMYTYNDDNILASNVLQAWAGGEWVNSRQSVYAYDANENLSSEIDQQWNNNTWENDNFITYTYNTENILISEIFQNWNGQNWINLTKEIYSYDQGNNPTIKLYQYWNGNAWVDEYRFVNNYDAGNNLIDATYQKWNGNEWLNRSQYIYTYDDHSNMIIEHKKEWDSNTWTNSSLRVCNYDNHDNRTMDMLQNWNGINWANSERYTYTWDDNNFMESQSFIYWNMAGTEILGEDSIYYYFHTALGINELTTEEIVAVYPNPCRDKFTIQCNCKVLIGGIYNLSGELIHQLNGIASGTANVIDLRTYPKGLYIIRIYTGTKTYATKIIYQ